MTTPPFTISVVIAVYTEERWRYLMALVQSLRRQTVQPREIIIVVDHNSALLARIRSALPAITVAANREARGAAGARNTGVALARGEIIAFIDDDAEAAPDWLEQLALCYHDPRVLGAGGAIEPRWRRGRPAWFPDEFDWVVGCTYRGMPENVTAVRNLIAANMSVRRSVFLTLGGFRAGFGNCKGAAGGGLLRLRPRAGDEETEFCIRARQGHPHTLWLYLPGAKVYHHVPATRARWRYYLARCFDEGLGKAALTRLLGSHDGLSSEVAYTLRVLPSGLARSVADLWVRRDITGLVRAAAIVAGLMMAAIGYLVNTCAAPATRMVE